MLHCAGEPGLARICGGTAPEIASWGISLIATRRSSDMSSGLEHNPRTAPAEQAEQPVLIDHGWDLPRRLSVGGHRGRVLLSLGCLEAIVRLITFFILEKP